MMATPTASLPVSFPSPATNTKTKTETSSISTSIMNSKMGKSYKGGEYVLDVLPNDVLLGRGSGPNDHKGNIKFRDMVSHRKHEYQSTNNRQSKTLIAEEIVDQIYDNGGRFLRKLNQIDSSKQLPMLLLAANKLGITTEEKEEEKEADNNAEGPRDVYEIQNNTTVLEKAKQALRQNVQKISLSPTNSMGGRSPTNSKSTSRKTVTLTPPSSGGGASGFHGGGSGDIANANANAMNNNNGLGGSFQIPPPIFTMSDNQNHLTYAELLHQQQQQQQHHIVSSSQSSGLSLAQQQQLIAQGQGSSSSSSLQMSSSSLQYQQQYQQQQQQQHHIVSSSQSSGLSLAQHQQLITQGHGSSASSSLQMSSSSLQYQQQQQQVLYQQQQQLERLQLELKLRLQQQQHQPQQQQQQQQQGATMSVHPQHQHNVSTPIDVAVTSKSSSTKADPTHVLNGYATYTTTLDEIEEDKNSNGNKKRALKRTSDSSNKSLGDVTDMMKDTSSSKLGGTSDGGCGDEEDKSMQMSTMMESFKDISFKSGSGKGSNDNSITRGMHMSIETIGSIDNIPGNMHVGGLSMAHMSGISMMSMMNDDSTDSLYKSKRNSNGGNGTQNATWGVAGAGGAATTFGSGGGVNNTKSRAAVLAAASLGLGNITANKRSPRVPPRRGSGGSGGDGVPVGDLTAAGGRRSDESLRLALNNDKRVNSGSNISRLDSSTKTETASNITGNNGDTENALVASAILSITVPSSADIGVDGGTIPNTNSNNNLSSSQNERRMSQNPQRSSFGVNELMNDRMMSSTSFSFRNSSMGNIHSNNAAAAAAATSGPNSSSGSTAGRLSSAGGSSNMSFNTFYDTSYFSVSAAGQGGVDNELGGSGSGADRFSLGGNPAPATSNRLPPTSED